MHNYYQHNTPRAVIRTHRQFLCPRCGAAIRGHCLDVAPGEIACTCGVCSERLVEIETSALMRPSAE